MCVLRIKETKRHNIDGFPLRGGVKNLAIEEQKRKNTQCGNSYLEHSAERKCHRCLSIR